MVHYSVHMRPPLGQMNPILSPTPGRLFPSASLTNCMHFSSHTRSTCYADLILLNLATLITFVEALYYLILSSILLRLPS